MALDISSLVLSLTRWEIAGYAALAVTAIGCVGEALCDFTNWIPEDAKRRAGRLSATLVILGLSAEGITQVKTNGLSGQIIAALNLEARDAELELVKLETPRTVRPDQEDRIIKQLKLAPKGPVSVVAAFLDETDAKPFAKSIKDTLTAAGFTLVPPPSKFLDVAGWSIPGAWMFVHGLSEGPLYASAIQHAFAAEGIYLKGQAEPDTVPVGVLVIGVSSHPFKPDPVPPQLLNGNATAK